MPGVEACCPYNQDALLQLRSSSLKICGLLQVTQVRLKPVRVVSGTLVLAAKEEEHSRGAGLAAGQLGRAASFPERPAPCHRPAGESAAGLLRARQITGLAGTKRQDSAVALPHSHACDCM